ncbi:hypothetical protein IL306_001442, partial [Fusarium sp. DS 682]
NGKEVEGCFLRVERKRSKTTSDSEETAYIIFRKNTRPVQFDEVRSIFSCYGPIEKIEVLDHYAQTQLDVPPSLLVQFSRFDPKREVIRVSSIPLELLVLGYQLLSRRMMSLIPNTVPTLTPASLQTREPQSPPGVIKPTTYATAGKEESNLEEALWLLQAPCEHR